MALNSLKRRFPARAVRIAEAAEALAAPAPAAAEPAAADARDFMLLIAKNDLVPRRNSSPVVFAQQFTRCVRTTVYPLCSHNSLPIVFAQQFTRCAGLARQLTVNCPGAVRAQARAQRRGPAGAARRGLRLARPRRGEHRHRKGARR